MKFTIKFWTEYNPYSQSGALERVVTKEYKDWGTAKAACTRIWNRNRYNAVRGKCKEYVHSCITPTNETMNVYRMVMDGDTKLYREVTAHDADRAKAVMNFYKPILGLSGKKIKNVTIAG